MQTLNWETPLNWPSSRNHHRHHHHCSTTPSLTSHCPRSQLLRSETTHGGMLGWFEGQRKEKRVQARRVGGVRAGTGLRDRAPVCVGEQMVALAGTGTARAHPQEGAKHRRIHLFILSTSRSLFSPSLAPCSLSTSTAPRYSAQRVLKLAARWPRGNMASDMCEIAVNVEEVAQGLFVNANLLISSACRRPIATYDISWRQAVTHYHIYTSCTCPPKNVK